MTNPVETFYRATLKKLYPMYSRMIDESNFGEEFKTTLRTYSLRSDDLRDYNSGINFVAFYENGPLCNIIKQFEKPYTLIILGHNMEVYAWGKITPGNKWNFHGKIKFHLEVRASLYIIDNENYAECEDKLIKIVDNEENQIVITQMSLEGERNIASIAL